MGGAESKPGEMAQNEAAIKEFNKIVKRTFGDYKKILNRKKKEFLNSELSRTQFLDDIRNIDEELQSGKIMYMGSRGGVFKFNKFGNKSYVSSR